jgi:hypothetical protein
VGFSAQAVREVIPEAVTESTGGYLQINADPILWTMVNALKDLKTENDALAGRNADLERRIAALKRLSKGRRVLAWLTDLWINVPRDYSLMMGVE